MPNELSNSKNVMLSNITFVIFLQISYLPETMITPTFNQVFWGKYLHRICLPLCTIIWRPSLFKWWWNSKKFSSYIQINTTILEETQWKK